MTLSFCTFIVGVWAVCVRCYRSRMSNTIPLSLRLRPLGWNDDCRFCVKLRHGKVSCPKVPSIRSQSDLFRDGNSESVYGWPISQLSSICFSIFPPSSTLEGIYINERDIQPTQVRPNTPFESCPIPTSTSKIPNAKPHQQLTNPFPSQYENRPGHITSSSSTRDP
jgi:hypothetical protein